MPPKVAAPAAPAVVKNFLLEVRLTCVECEGLRVRFFSEWLSCCGVSGFFGQGEQLWEAIADSEKKISKYQTSFEALLSDAAALNAFNSKPAIYAVLLRDVVENDLIVAVPVGFTAIDCSPFAMEAVKTLESQIIVDGIQLDFKAAVENPLIPPSTVICYEPVLFDIKCLNDYPILQNESSFDAYQTVYAYGELKLVSGLTRTILGFPRLIKPTPTADEEAKMDDEKITTDFDLKLCLLPGLSDIAQFRDLLSSSTYVVEIHREDLYKRAFHSRNVNEFNAILTEENGGVPRTVAPVVPDKGAKGGKGAPPAKGGAAAAAPEAAGAGVFAVMTRQDKFLLQCITRALTTSRQLKPHGTVRIRLEQLLSSSNDLLAQFKRRRTGREEGDDNIVVQENMLLEVRLEKPSKPEKWDLPADISLKSALSRAKTEAQSKLDGTLALSGGTLAGTVGAGGRNSQPRHEMFLTCGTNVEMSVAYHRKMLPELIAPPPEPAPPTISKSSSVGRLAKDKSKAALKATEPVQTEEEKLLLKKLAVTPFTRMIFVFRYSDDETLSAITEAITKVNSNTLCDIQGTIRSYSLTEQEREDSISGKLDLISGFMIIDDDMRLICVEGLAAPNKGMQSLFVDLPRMKANDDSLKILCNPEVLFPTRAYPDFSPDLRRIRVRDKLKKLARRPEIYNRKQVEEICFEAIDGVMRLKRATDLKSTKELDMYPTAESLNKLELLYGEAISLIDMDGKPPPKGAAASASLAGGSLAEGGNRSLASRQRVEGSEAKGDAKGEEGAASLVGSVSMRSEYTWTDCRNPQFEEYLRTRPQHRVDHIAENREIRKRAWTSALQKTLLRDEQAASTVRQVLGIPEDSDHLDEESTDSNGNPIPRVAPPKEPKVYMYSTQYLNYKAKAFDHLRSRVADDKNATYTFSQDFVSQTVCVVDEETEKKRHAAEMKSQMLTAKGFQYPKPKTRLDLIRHPKRPSEARIEDLKAPYMDATDVKHNVNDTQDPEMKAAEDGFQTRFKEVTLFGSLKPAEYEREFQLKLVGDKTKLPRGHLLPIGKEPDPDAFRSIHLVDEEKQRLIEETAAQEKADWQAKVKVDHLDFKMCGFKVRDKVIPAQRATDILKGEAQKLSLQKLRTMTTHTGKDISYQTTPLSLMSSGPYIQNAAAKALVRQSDATKFITARDAVNGEPPVDFVRFINCDSTNAKILSVLAKKKHPPQDRNSTECQGPRWDPASGASAAANGGGGVGGGKYDHK